MGMMIDSWRRPHAPTPIALVWSVATCKNKPIWEDELGKREMYWGVEHPMNSFYFVELSSYWRPLNTSGRSPAVYDTDRIGRTPAQWSKDSPNTAEARCWFLVSLEHIEQLLATSKRPKQG